MLTRKFNRLNFVKVARVAAVISASLCLTDLLFLPKRHLVARWGFGGCGPLVTLEKCPEFSIVNSYLTYQR